MDDFEKNTTFWAAPLKTQSSDFATYNVILIHICLGIIVSLMLPQ